MHSSSRRQQLVHVQQLHLTASAVHKAQHTGYAPHSFIDCSCREDEYDVTYVYGAEASNDDLHARSISPLIRKCLEGYNVCVMLFGATGKHTGASGGCCS